MKDHKVEIDAKFQNEIDTYGQRIVTIKDEVLAIRQMPGMYCAGLGNAGFLSLIREIYQNSLDQIIDSHSPANLIYLSYNENTLEVICSDNGLGFPFDDMVRIVTAQHTSKNYVKRKGEYSSGLHGAGLKVVNALSTECNVESYRYDGTAKRIDLIEGHLSKGPYDIKNKDHKQGSVVRFVPCTEVLGDISLEWRVVYHLIKDLLSLTPLGSEVKFMAIGSDGAVHNEDIVNTDGIITKLISNVKYPMCKPIIISYDDGEHKIDAAFTYDSGGEQGPDPNAFITAFCNMCPTDLGTHIDGTMNGIIKWFSDYMNNIYLSNQKAKIKTKVTSADIKSGLNIMISAACLEPSFIGQAKEKLQNIEMAPFCKDVMINGLEQWSKSNPQDLAKLSKYFKDIADIRMKSEGEKVKLVTKYAQNALTGMPEKYARPTVRQDEIIFVEGDSAGGSAKQARDVKTQGIFPLRGKIPSAFEKSKNEFFSNAEIQGIAKIIIGRDYVRNFDISEVKWKKIIIMADADVDGAHIATLILRYFVLYMPQLLEAGLVYKALPPLYSFKNGKRVQYLTNQLDFVRYVQKCFVQSNTICDLKKRPLTAKEMTLLFMANEDYVYELERLHTTYAVDAQLLEFALFAYISKTPYETIKKRLKEKFRFMDVSKEKGSLIYTGVIKDSNFLVMNDKLVADCQRVLSIIEKNSSVYYIMNGEKKTIYDIMKAFDDSTPSGIKRYKGLGEMNPEQLAVAVLRPDADRALVRYTFEDAKEELEIIRSYESDRSKLLDHVGIVKRKDLLD